MKLAAIAPRTISFHQARHVSVASALSPRVESAARTAERREPGRVRLTPRELEVLALLCEGMPNKLIGRRLDISEGTVKIHVGKILSELDVSSRLQAVVAAHRRGIVGHSTVVQQDQACDSRGFPALTVTPYAPALQAA